MDFRGITKSFTIRILFWIYWIMEWHKVLSKKSNNDVFSTGQLNPIHCLVLLIRSFFIPRLSCVSLKSAHDVDQPSIKFI